MKKTIGFILFIFILTSFSVSNAKSVQYNNWKNNKKNTYDVYSFDDLYSVFEDLNYDYEKCQEELRGEIKYLNEKIDEYKQKNNDLEEELTTYKDKEKNNMKFIYFIPLILLAIPFIKEIRNKNN